MSLLHVHVKVVTAGDVIHRQGAFSSSPLPRKHIFPAGGGDSERPPLGRIAVEVLNAAVPPVSAGGSRTERILPHPHVKTAEINRFFTAYL